MSKEEFQNCHSLLEATKFVHDFGLRHKAYQYYTQMSTLEKILKHQCLWLTRCSSDRLNDNREHNKYGSVAVLDRMYIGCFSYGCAEQASMWGMYGPQSGESVRITFDGETIKNWRDKLMAKPPMVCPIVDGQRAKMQRAKTARIDDLVYAAVRDGDLSDDNRDVLPHVRTVYWNGRYCLVRSIASNRTIPRISGWVKDYEWLCENETRIGVVLGRKSAAEKIALRIPPYVINNMAITLSPWLPKSYYDAACKRIELAWPKKKGFVKWTPKFMLACSSLTGALNFI